MGMFELLLVVVVASAIFGAWLINGHLEKKRRQRVADLAKELQLELNWELPETERVALQRFEVARKGRNQRTSLSLLADNGETRICLFDYSFVVGSGKNQSTQHWVISLCTDERLGAPSMQLKPETFLSRIGSLVGFQDIDIPDAPEFSKTFVIQGADEARIREYLSPVRRNALLHQPKQTYALDQDHLLIVRERTKLDAKHIKPFLSESLKLVTALVETKN
jgi:hypothetical protein